MEALLQEIKMLPGILGCFVHSTPGVLFSNLPALFREEALKQIGGLLSRVFKLSDSTDMKIASFEIRFEESFVIVKRVDASSSLLVICEPSVSFPLVNMTTSMLLPELKSEIEKALKSPLPKPFGRAGAQETTPIAAVKIVTPEKVLEDPTFATPLQEVRMALAHAIGPMANYVILEAIAIWTSKDAPSKSRFRELANILVSEIGDKDLSAKFMTEIRHLL